MKTIFTFFRNIREELGLITWLPHEKTVRYTVIVIGISAAMGLILSGTDTLFRAIMERILN